MKMKSVVILGPKDIAIKDLECPRPGKNQVLVKVKSCNICTWEQRVYSGESRGLYPFNGGHEVVGAITEIGEDVMPNIYQIGSLVAIRTFDSCGACYYCRNNAGNLCTHKMKKSSQNETYEGIHNLGGFSSYIVADISMIYFLPADMEIHKGIFAEPLACVLNSIEQGRIEMGNDVVVIGGGIMGMLHVMCSKLKGARVILSEPDDRRRELAEELGADIVINPRECDPVEYIKKITDDRGADVVFNTTPIASVAAQAIGMVGYMGRVVMYSSQHPDKPIEISPNWLHYSQAIITGAVSPSVKSFEQSVNMLSKKLIDPSKLFYGSFNYQDAKKAYETAIRPDTYRCSIDFDD